MIMIRVSQSHITQLFDINWHFDDNIDNLDDHDDHNDHGDQGLTWRAHHVRDLPSLSLQPIYRPPCPLVMPAIITILFTVWHWYLCIYIHVFVCVYLCFCVSVFIYLCLCNWICVFVSAFSKHMRLHQGIPEALALANQIQHTLSFFDQLLVCHPRKTDSWPKISKKQTAGQKPGKSFDFLSFSVAFTSWRSSPYLASSTPPVHLWNRHIF